MNSPFSPQPSYPLSGESVLVIPPRFKQARNFSEGLAAVQVEVKLGRLSEDLWGFIDRKGDFVIEPQFDSVASFSEGLAPVSKEGIFGNWGYINKTGKFVIQISGYGRLFSEGLAVVKSSPDLQAPHGYIDKTGKWVIQPQFFDAKDFSEGLALVKSSKDDKWGYIDKTGKWVIKPKSEREYSGNFSEGLAIGRKVSPKGYSNRSLRYDYKYGYIDKIGNWVIQPQFGGELDFMLHPGSLIDIQNFSEGLAVVAASQVEWFFIDKTGKKWMDKKFTWAGGFKEGLSAVALRHDEGYPEQLTYINKKGEFIVKPRNVHKPTGFSEGLGTFAGGYIDKTGKWIIEPSFDEVHSFSEGLALVKIDGKYGYIRNPLQQQQADTFSLFR